MKIGKKVSKSIGKTINKGKEYAWRITIILVVVLGLILISRPLYSIITTSLEIKQLNREKARYKAEIHRDSIILENLKNDELLERYAREKYLMQGENEQVFIVK